MTNWRRTAESCSKALAQWCHTSGDATMTPLTNISMLTVMLMNAVRRSLQCEQSHQQDNSEKQHLLSDGQEVLAKTEKWAEGSNIIVLLSCAYESLFCWTLQTKYRYSVSSSSNIELHMKTLWWSWTLTMNTRWMNEWIWILTEWR